MEIRYIIYLIWRLITDRSSQSVDSIFTKQGYKENASVQTKQNAINMRFIICAKQHISWIYIPFAAYLERKSPDILHNQILPNSTHLENWGERWKQEHACATKGHFNWELSHPSSPLGLVKNFICRLELISARLSPAGEFRVV